jgi:hypothetical protein
MAMRMARVSEALQRLVQPALASANGAPAGSYSPEALREMEQALDSLSPLIADLQEAPDMSNQDPKAPRQATWRGRTYEVPAEESEPAAAATPAARPTFWRGQATAPPPAAAVAPSAPKAEEPAPAGNPGDPAVIFRTAGIPEIPCPVEEVAQLVGKYRDMDPEFARRAVEAALEFRPGASLPDIISDGERKLAAIRRYEEGRRQEVQRLRAEAHALIEQTKRRTLQAVAELEAQAAALKKQAEAEIEGLVRSVGERERVETEAGRPSADAAEQIQATLLFLRPGAAAGPPADGTSPSPNGKHAAAVTGSSQK